MSHRKGLRHTTTFTSQHLWEQHGGVHRAIPQVLGQPCNSRLRTTEIICSSSCRYARWPRIYSTSTGFTWGARTKTINTDTGLQADSQADMEEELPLAKKSSPCSPTHNETSDPSENSESRSLSNLVVIASLPTNNPTSSSFGSGGYTDSSNAPRASVGHGTRAAGLQSPSISSPHSQLRQLAG